MTYKPSLFLDGVFIRGVSVKQDKNGIQIGSVALEIMGVKAEAVAEMVRLQRAGGLTAQMIARYAVQDEEEAAPHEGVARPQETPGDGTTVTLSSAGESVTLTQRELEELARGRGARSDAEALVEGVIRRVRRGPAPPGVDTATGEIKDGGDKGHDSEGKVGE